MLNISPGNPVNPLPPGQPLRHPLVSNYPAIKLDSLPSVLLTGRTLEIESRQGAKAPGEAGGQAGEPARINLDLAEMHGNCRWVRAVTDGPGNLLELENKNGDIYFCLDACLDTCTDSTKSRPGIWYRRLKNGNMEKAILFGATLRLDGIVVWKVSGSDSVSVNDYPDGSKFTDWGDGKATVMNKFGKLVTIRRDQEGFLVFSGLKAITVPAGHILAITIEGACAVSRMPLGEPEAAIEPWPDQNYRRFADLHLLF